MKLSREQIQNGINKIGIKTNGIVRNGWMEILCPNPGHADKHYGNAAIYMDTGKIHCFSCHINIGLIDFLKTYYNYTVKQAFDFLNDGVLFVKPLQTIQIQEEKKEKIKQLDYDFTYLLLNPDKYFYTKQRGFTKKFCEDFNIVHCISGQYEDYMIVPIKDKNKNVSIFEARRLKEHELLCKYFNVVDGNNKRLKKKFEQFIADKGLFWSSDKQIIDEAGNKYFDNNLKYLLQRKVFYPYLTDPNMTIWNIDNLDRTKDLYLVEGFGSIPKVYQHISKNCSCVFGSNISNDQIEYLKQFKRVIYIPDKDRAGLLSVELLHRNLEDLLIIDADVKDTDYNYVTEISNTQLIPSNEYISHYGVQGKAIL